MAANTEQVQALRSELAELKSHKKPRVSNSFPWILGLVVLLLLSAGGILYQLHRVDKAEAGIAEKPKTVEFVQSWHDTPLSDTLNADTEPQASMYPVSAVQ